MYHMYPDYAAENNDFTPNFNHRASKAELAKWEMGMDLDDQGDFVDASRVASADRHTQTEVAPSPKILRGAGYVSVKPMVLG